MLNTRLPGPRRMPAVLWLFLLLVPFAVSACITVESDLLETPAPSAATATPSATPSQASLPTPTPMPTPEPVEAEVLGFVPYWLLAEAAAGIDPELLDIVAFHSVESSGKGRLVSKKPSGDVPPGWDMLEGERFAEVKDELQAAGVKVVPVIQRTAWTEGTRERMVELLSKKKNRRTLVESIVSFVDERGFDGVNLDFEPLPTKIADQYVLLVRELRTALDELDPELHLSVDVVPSLENYDLAKLTADDAADLAVIMGYGYRTPSAGTAGSTAPLSDGATGDLTSTVAAALDQADAQRLLLGLPWYGIDWATDSAAAGAATRSGKNIAEASTLDYVDARAQAVKTGREYDSDQASAWTSYATRGCDDCTPTWRQAWYDDPDSFAAKLDLALEQGLAGIGIWTLGMAAGEEDMWLALRQGLFPRLDELPPGGSPALDPDTEKGSIDGRSVVSGSASLRLFASDEEDGSGLAFVRVGLDDKLDSAGMLVTGRTYPAVDRLEFPLGDEETGGSSAEGPRSIHIQWRDLAGNWSVPVVIEAHALAPDTTLTPADL